VFWGNLVFDQVDLGVIQDVLMCDPLPLSRDGPCDLGVLMKMDMTTLLMYPLMQ
jgi:hypothetical protein